MKRSVFNQEIETAVLKEAAQYVNIAIDLYHACHVFGPILTSYCSTSAMQKTNLLYN
ncbi:hypothetical protein ACOSZF_20335 [Cytobacillus firmus]|uniref:hypothetical protein n=1 Tax=Cytobacillus firmus TaxID=1399 RepID=UPI003B9EAE80